MPSPFPGMDPYLEDPVEWPDVHVRLMVAMSRQLAPKVSPSFYVRVEQRVWIVDPEAGERRLLVPDVFLARQGTAPPQLPTATAMIEAPVLVTVLEELEAREHYIEIYDSRSREVVATIEVLSPVNKAPGPKRAAFLEKREAVMSSPAHWIEIDLLRAGARPDETDGLCDYYALLKRARRPRAYEIWFRSLRDRLPTIAIPLRDSFPDVPLDLQAALDEAYAEARYDEQLSYQGAPPPPALLPADAEWVRQRVAAWRQERGA